MTPGTFSDDLFFPCLIKKGVREHFSYLQRDPSVEKFGKNCPLCTYTYLHQSLNAVTTCYQRWIQYGGWGTFFRNKLIRPINFMYLCTMIDIKRDRNSPRIRLFHPGPDLWGEGERYVGKFELFNLNRKFGKKMMILFIHTFF